MDQNFGRPAGSDASDAWANTMLSPNNTFQMPLRTSEQFLTQGEFYFIMKANLQSPPNQNIYCVLQCEPLFIYMPYDLIPIFRKVSPTAYQTSTLARPSLEITTWVPWEPAAAQTPTRRPLGLPLACHLRTASSR